MNKKIKILAATALSFAVVTATAIAVSNLQKHSLFESIAQDEPYVLVLDDKNQPTVSGTDFYNNITEYIRFRYQGTGMDVAANRHIRTGSSGATITSVKQIRKITNIKVTAPVNNSNHLTLFVGYTLEEVEARTYAYPINGTSEVSIDVKCNYFALYSDRQFGLSNVTVTYECPADESSYVKPAASLDKPVLHYGDGLSVSSGTYTLRNGQIAFADGNDNRYSYKYLTLDVKFRCPNAFSGDISTRNLGFQFNKTIQANGAFNGGYQLFITNLGDTETTFTLKNGGTEVATKTVTTFVKAQFVPFHFEVRENADPTKVDLVASFTWNSVTTVLFEETLNNIAYATKYVGIRHANVSGTAYPQFKDFTLTGHN